MTTDELLSKAIAILRMRAENDEINLSYFPLSAYRNRVSGKIEGGSPPWTAEACNPSWAVCLGEVPGVYRGEGFTLHEALQALVADIETGVRSDRERNLTHNGMRS